MAGAETIATGINALLRCPKCGRKLVAIGPGMFCEQGHEYSISDGVPRLIEGPWDAAGERLSQASSDAFGQQWNRLGEEATVTLEDLKLHLPNGWPLSTFSGSILDAGCGMGRYAALLATLSGSVVGIDRSEAVITAARLWPQIPFIQGDLVAAPFAPRSFDVVCSFGVLHHLPDPLRGLKASYDLVKPGGLLLVWVYSERKGLFRFGRRSMRRLVGFDRRVLGMAAAVAAAAMWVLAVAPRRYFRRIAVGRPFYDDKGLRQLYVDCYDALSAPSECYLTAADCARWLAALGSGASGFERRRDGSGWVVWARRIEEHSSARNRTTSLD